MCKYCMAFQLSEPVNNLEQARDYLLDATDMVDILKEEKEVVPFKDSIIWIDWVLYDRRFGYVRLVTKDELSEEQLKVVKEWVDNQNSDGLGEGFSGQDFAYDDADENYESISSISEFLRLK